MNKSEFDKTGFGGRQFLKHEGVEKYIISVIFPSRVFGVLSGMPNNFEESDWTKVEWVRCENISDIEMRQEGEYPVIDMREVDKQPVTLISTKEDPKWYMHDEEECLVYCKNEKENLLGLLYFYPDEGDELPIDDESFHQIMWVRDEDVGEIYTKPDFHGNPDQLNIFG